MASAKIEKEIDDFVSDNPNLRGKYPLSNHLQVMPTDQYYDTLWRQQLKQIKREEITNCF